MKKTANARTHTNPPKRAQKPTRVATPAPAVQETSANREVQVVFAMIAALVLPATVALWTVKHPGRLVIDNPNPTPYGYTWSLVVFLLPVLLLGWWFRRVPKTTIERRAFAWTVVLFTGAGFALDIWLGNTFFVFPNRGATSGLYLPGYDWVEGWRVNLPIEEFFFYYLGALFMVLVYIWGDVYWFGRYNDDDYSTAAGTLPKLVHPHAISLLIGVVLVVGGILFKKFGPHPDHAGFPAYWTLLVLVAIVPSSLFFPSVKPVINWRAFSFTLFSLLLISLIWEATLGVPYQWWGYDRRWMLGIRLDAWSNLPLEAVVMWFAAGWGIVIVFEVLRIHFAMQRPISRSLFGEKTP